MGRVRTQEEVESENLVRLGPELGPVFSKLSHELAWLQIIWCEYRELYGTKPERLEILNASAKTFFYTIQRSMWNEVLLRIRRLTDPAKTGDKQNLTIMRLGDLCEDPELANRVRALATLADEKSRFAKKWRDREIAHADLGLALGRSAEPLPEVSRSEVTDAIAAIHVVLNTISKKLMSAEIHDEPIIGPNGALALLYVLRDGLRAEAEQRHRIQTGQYTADDVKRSDAL